MEDKNLGTCIQIAANRDYPIDFSRGDIWIDLFFEDHVQVDTAANLFNKKGQIMQNPVHHGNPISKCSCVTMVAPGHRDCAGCNNVFHIKLTSISVHVCQILILAFIRSELPGNRLNEAKIVMRSGSVRCHDVVMCESRLTDVSGPRVVLGQLTRTRSCWSFRILKDQLHQEEIDRCFLGNAHYPCLAQRPVHIPEARSVVVTVLAGRNLAMKDVSLLTGRPYASDPYFIISFKTTNSYKSEYNSKTVEPVWETHPFFVKEIIEAEKEEIEIALYDYDFLKNDDFMGAVYISAKFLFKAELGVQELWLPVGRSKNPELQQEEVSGEIRVELDISEVVT